jgi:hypothetical protein
MASTNDSKSSKRLATSLWRMELDMRETVQNVLDATPSFHQYVLERARCPACNALTLSGCTIVHGISDGGRPQDPIIVDARASCATCSGRFKGTRRCLVLPVLNQPEWVAVSDDSLPLPAGSLPAGSLPAGPLPPQAVQPEGSHVNPGPATTP